MKFSLTSQPIEMGSRTRVLMLNIVLYTIGLNGKKQISFFVPYMIKKIKAVFSVKNSGIVPQ